MSKLKIKHAGMFLLLIASCKEQDKNLRQVADRNMCVQVTKISPTAGDSSAAIFYKVRIIPSAAFMTIHPSIGNRHYWYEMDSCFYLSYDGKKQFPEIVEPVANGAKDNYEYLVQFIKDKSQSKQDSVSFFFSDKGTNPNIYKLKLAY